MLVSKKLLLINIMSKLFTNPNKYHIMIMFIATTILYYNYLKNKLYLEYSNV